ncbi:hypothetical protein D3C87_2156670 [compost metagenome]
MLRHLMAGDHVAEQGDAHHQQADGGGMIDRFPQHHDEFRPGQLAIDHGAEEQGVDRRDHGRFGR